MARVVSTRDRCHQVKRWLEIEFPVDRNVRLRVEALTKDSHPDDIAQCFTGRPALIRIKKGRPLGESIESVIHEWAHLRTERFGAFWIREGDGHDEHFYLEEGKIKIAFRDYGADASREN